MTHTGEKPFTVSSADQPRIPRLPPLPSPALQSTQQGLASVPVPAVAAPSREAARYGSTCKHSIGSLSLSLCLISVALSLLPLLSPLSIALSPLDLALSCFLSALWCRVIRQRNPKQGPKPRLQYRRRLLNPSSRVQRGASLLRGAVVGCTTTTMRRTTTMMTTMRKRWSPLTSRSHRLYRRSVASPSESGEPVHPVYRMRPILATLTHLNPPLLRPWLETQWKAAATHRQLVLPLLLLLPLCGPGPPVANPSRSAPHRPHSIRHCTHATLLLLPRNHPCLVVALSALSLGGFFFTFHCLMPSEQSVVALRFLSLL